MVDPQPPSDTSFRIGPLALAVILAFTLASALGISPYYFGTGDNRITIPILKAIVDPSLYPGDRMLAERPFYYTYLWSALGLLHARLGLDLRLLFLGTYLASLFLTFLSVYRIALALFHDRATAVLSLLLLAFSGMTLGGIPTLEQSLTTRAVATPIALLAFYAFLRGRTVRSFALLGLAYLVHPITTAFVLAMLVVASVVVRRPRRLRTLATGLLVFLAIASPLLAWRLRSSPPTLHLFSADPGWLEALRLRSSVHLFPFSWGPGALVHALVAMALFYLAARHGGGRSSEGHVAVRSAVWTIVGLCVAGTIFSELHPIGLDFLLQPMRSFVFMEFLVILYVAHYVAGTEADRPLLDWTIVVLAAVWITFGSEDLAHGIIEIMVLVIALGLRRFGWREGRLARHFAAAMALLVCLGAWACYLDDRWSRGGSDFSIDVSAPGRWRDVQRWAKDHTDVRDGFIVPPDQESEFRVEGERTVYGDWEEGSLMNFDPAFGREWLRRMRALGFEDSEAYRFHYRDLGVAEFRLLAAEMALPGRRVLVVRSASDPPLDLPVRYRNKDFTVYEMPGDRPTSG